MERTVSIEEKIRRAEEIYEKRKQGNTKNVTNINVNNKKDLKLLKKLIKQLAVSLCIYLIVYVIQNSNYIFSQDFLNKTKDILSYDTNWQEIYDNLKEKADGIINNTLNLENNSFNDEEQQEENKEQQENIIENQSDNNIEAIGGAGSNSNENINIELSQEEKDIMSIKNATTFIKPVQGVISSKYGRREQATGSVPKNHTGTDIAANLGTKIISATEGEVVLASEQGDYGKHLKIQIGQISIIYAHCNSLYVKQGDKVVQGQEIAEVGTTGNSTGPHLHFEIRYEERAIDPEKILEL